MPKMIAKAGFEYDRRRLKKGEAFVASSRDARVLALGGRAQLAEEPAPPASTGGLEVSGVIVDDPELQAKPQRRYRRRDMQAGA